MSFDLKLFQFESSQPYITSSNGAQYFKLHMKKNPQRKFTLKSYNIQNSKHQESIENDLKIHLQSQSCHQNIIQIKGHTIIESKDEFGFINNRFCILLENIHCTLDDLKNQKIAQKKHFELVELKDILLTIIDVLKQLETNDIAYRNLNLNSIFLVDGDIFKLGEFNEAINTIGLQSSILQDLSSQQKSHFYQNHFIDPELYKSFLQGDQTAEVNHYKIDVYSLAMIMLELGTLENLPFNNLNQTKLNQLLDNLNQRYNSSLKDIISLMTKPRNIRPNFIQLSEIIKDSGTNNQIQLSQIPEAQYESGEVNSQKNINSQRLVFNSNQIDDLEVRIDFSQQNSNYIQNKPHKYILNEEEKINIVNSLDYDQCESQIFEYTDQLDQIQEVDDEYVQNNRKWYEKQSENIFNSQELVEKATKIDNQQMEESVLIVRLDYEVLEKKLHNFQNIIRIKHNLIIIDNQNKMNSNIEEEIYSCTLNQQQMTVRIIQRLENQRIYELLYLFNFFNSTKYKKIVKIESYAIQTLDNSYSKLYLVTKNKKQDLHNAMKNSKFSIGEKINIAIQIIEGINEIQNNGEIVIIHGNLKPTNILLDNKNKIYISGFGVHQMLSLSQKINKYQEGTYLYSPPEQILDNKIEASTDIWSLGIIFYELFFGVYIDQDVAQTNGMYDKSKKGCLKVKKDLIKTRIQEMLAQLISKMTVFQTNDRMNLIQIIPELNKISQFNNHPTFMSNEEPKKNKSSNKNLKQGNSLEIIGTQFKKPSITQFDHNNQTLEQIYYPTPNSKSKQQIGHKNDMKRTPSTFYGDKNKKSRYN